MWKWSLVSITNLSEVTSYEIIQVDLNTGVTTVKLVFFLMSMLSLLIFCLKRAADFTVFTCFTGFSIWNVSTKDIVFCVCKISY